MEEGREMEWRSVKIRSGQGRAGVIGGWALGARSALGARLAICLGRISIKSPRRLLGHELAMQHDMHGTVSSTDDFIPSAAVDESHLLSHRTDSQFRKQSRTLD